MPHFEPVSYAILIASIIPVAFLYLIKWLDFFETHRVRPILLALVWEPSRSNSPTLLTTP